MFWFIIAFIGYFLLAVVFVLDKFILTKSVSKPVVYTFYSTIFMFGALLLWPFGAELLLGIDWWIAATSGVAFGLALYAMYTAVRIGEASHMTPFMGAVITIATYAIAALFLDEQLSSLQIGGIVVLTVAGLLLSFERSQEHDGFHRGFLWAIAAGLLFAVSHTTAKYIYELYPFLTGFMWTRAATGLVGVAALLSPAVWQTFSRRKRSKDEKQSGNPPVKNSRAAVGAFAKEHAFGIVVTDKVLGIAGVVLIQYAIAIGSVSIVNALAGIQFVFMFVLVYVLTKFAPRILREYITKRELLAQSAALLLIVIGSALFVIKL